MPAHLNYVDVIEQISPATPPAGFVRIYPKTDHKLYSKDSTGAEVDLTAGGGAGVTNPLVLTDTTSTLTFLTDEFGNGSIVQNGGSNDGELNIVSQHSGLGRVEIYGATEVQNRTDNGGEITLSNTGGILLFANSNKPVQLQGDSGASELIIDEFGVKHVSGNLGFFNTTPIAKPTSVTARVALESLGLGATLVAETLVDGDIPATIARDSEVTTAVSNHAAAADPHTEYLQESVISGLATPAIVLGTAAAAGTGTTPIRHNATIAAFDATAPSTQAFGDAAVVGVINFAARRDHKHAMPAAPTVHTHDGTGGATSLIIGGTAEAGASIPVASSVGSIAIGDYAGANTGTQPIAIGTGISTTSAPTASAQGAIAIGASNATGVAGAKASGISAIAIGSGTATNVGASAVGQDSIAIGRQAIASAWGGIAIGWFANSDLTGSVSVGNDIDNLGLRTVAIGENCAVTSGGSEGIVLGVNASVSAAGSIAVGSNATSSAAGSISIGAYAAAFTGAQAIAIGGGVNGTAAPDASGQGAIAIGGSNGAAVAGARASGISSIAIGSGDATITGASASGADSIALGRKSVSSIIQGIAIGSFAAATTGAEAIAIGSGVSATASPLANAQGAIAIGASNATGVAGARASGTTSIAIGSGDGSFLGASASGAGGVAIGSFSVAGNTSGIALGTWANASRIEAIAIGANCRAAGTGQNQIAIGGGDGTGTAAYASVLGAIAIGGSSGTGTGARAAGLTSVAIGSGNATTAGASASATDAIALGRTALAAHATAVALGTGATTTAANQIMMGTATEQVVFPGTSKYSNYQDIAEISAPATPAANTVRLYAKADGLLYSKDDAGVETAVTSDVQDILPMGISGTLVAGNGTARFYFPFNATILAVSASVGTAPTGASIIFDINKNGTTIFTTQGNRPTIAISGFYSGETVPNVTSVTAGDYLTVDRDQVGSTIAGADANLVIRYRRI